MSTNTFDTTPRPRTHDRLAAVPHLVAAILGLAFLASGALKLTPAGTTTMAALGIPAVLAVAVGLVELTAGAALFVPAWRPWAALALNGVMAGAVVTLATRDPAGIIAPTGFAIALTWLAWHHRPQPRDQVRLMLPTRA